MLGLSAILSVGALTALSTLNDRFDKAVNQTATKIELASEIDAKQSKMFANQRGIVICTFSKDAACVQQYGREFDNDGRSLREKLNTLRPLLVLDRGRQLTKSMESNLDQWLSHHQQLLASANAGQP